MPAVHSAGWSISQSANTFRLRPGMMSMSLPRCRSTMPVANTVERIGLARANAVSSTPTAATPSMRSGRSITGTAASLNSPVAARMTKLTIELATVWPIGHCDEIPTCPASPFDAGSQLAVHLWWSVADVRLDFLWLWCRPLAVEGFFFRPAQPHDHSEQALRCGQPIRFLAHTR